MNVEERVGAGELVDHLDNIGSLPEEVAGVKVRAHLWPRRVPQPQ